MWGKEEGDAGDAGAQSHTSCLLLLRFESFWCKQRRRGWSSDRETKDQQQISVILPWNTDHASRRRLKSSLWRFSGRLPWVSPGRRAFRDTRWLALCPASRLINICMSELPHPLLLCERSTPASVQGLQRQCENIRRGKCQAQHFFFLVSIWHAWQRHLTQLSR